MFHMNIVLKCCVVEKLDGDGSIKNDRYVGLFQCHPNGKKQIRIVMDCPMVPGEKYEFRLHGLFPGSCDNRPCSSNILEFSSPETLFATDLFKQE